MEISKGLQEEIILVQNKLKNAIRDHQICVGRLKDEPNNSDILGKIQEIQLHIVSLGRCQKQIVERLRKEVEVYRAENANGGKVSLAALLGLNNNNHITTYNDKKDEVKVQANGIDVRRSSRDNYDDFGRNGGVSGRRNLCAKERSSSVETLSADEDVIEVSNDENSTERQSETSEIEASVMEDDQSNVKQVNFLSNLGLITTGQLCELQNKKTERKRRSTANPQFVYPNWDLPSKRKRHAYLQSVGTAPQTRQTTARLNGPSPPPVKAPPKSTSPPTKTISKNSIPQQKSAVRPNILRTMQETRASQNRSKLDNGTSQREAKVVETKSVHIPGLPSSLTIERIENDTAVCINCRNPGTLTMCDTCSANYHISCHTISPPPPRQCPKCVQKKKEEERSTPIIKKDDELEEKERERYEQRERNSDLRLQVYELEKRSQLLGQSLQLQHRMRQELLGKQEKTQKSIKRLVDFIKLMQQSNDKSHPAQSASFQPPPSSSPLLQVPSPPPTPTPRCPPSPSPPTSPTPPSASTPSPIITRASPTSNPIPQLPIPLIQLSNSTSLSKSCQPPRLSRSYQRISPKLEISMQSPQISPNHRPCSSTSSPEVPRSPSQDSIQSVHPQTTWNHRTSPKNHVHQYRVTNQMPITPSPPQIHQMDQTQLSNHVSVLTQSQIHQLPSSPSPHLADNQNHQTPQLPQLTPRNQVIYTTQCSQAITSPISSPIVLMNHRGTIYGDRPVSHTGSQEDSPRIEQRITDLDSPPPSSPNT
ncbi:serine/arginine repetitive matrix protein 1-like isoform X2 [Diachasmimorpha longicaudata]|uniref:serine/arginine repetitive matrix protein 1-like isoform X2 n=1 Tax=Diachasmimorpha longicaudata TaxID=58733 RepID=UPI0030B8AB5C